MSLDQFSFEEILGSGAYATVYKVKRLSDGNYFALKKVKLLNLSEKERENSLNEVRLLASIRDPNIISYKECFYEQNSSSLWFLFLTGTKNNKESSLVMEFADDGDLFERIKHHQQKKTFFPEEEIWDIFIQIVFGLKALHDVKICHRDLKTANVFLFKDGSAKLGDFNVSKIVKDGLLKTQTGTPFYASPEIWKNAGYDQKSDIWSLGCIVYEMACLRPPFHSEDMEGLSKKAIKGVYHKLPDHYSQELVNIVADLLQVFPEKRPDCAEILSKSSVSSRFKERNFFVLDESRPEMLKTIKCPKNLKNIHHVAERLPHQNYETLNCKKVDSKTLLEYINGNSNSKTPEKIKHENCLSHSNPNSGFPKIQESFLENNQILTNNNELLLVKPGNKIKYIRFLKNPTMKNKKSCSPAPKPTYGNHKMGRNFLLEPLNIKKENEEDGRRLFGKNNQLLKKEDEEIHDLLHPKFDQHISLIQKIYGFTKDNEGSEGSHFKRNSRSEKKLLPTISSENKYMKLEKNKDISKIQKTDEGEKERKAEKLQKIKEIMKAYKIEGTITHKEIERILKARS